MGKSHNLRMAKLRAKKKLEKLAKIAATQVKALERAKKYPTQGINYPTQVIKYPIN